MPKLPYFLGTIVLSLIFVIFARSYSASETIRVSYGKHEISVGILCGQLRLSYRYSPQAVEKSMNWCSEDIGLYRLNDEFFKVRMGFAAEYKTITRRAAKTVYLYKILVPIWFLAIIPILLLGAYWLKVYLKNKQSRKQYLCIKCGYNLSSNSEQCPECGNTSSG